MQTVLCTYICANMNPSLLDIFLVHTLLLFIFLLRWCILAACTHHKQSDLDTHVSWHLENNWQTFIHISTMFKYVSWFGAWKPGCWLLFETELVSHLSQNHQILIWPFAFLFPLVLFSSLAFYLCKDPFLLFLKCPLSLQICSRSFDGFRFSQCPCFLLSSLCH